MSFEISRNIEALEMLHRVMIKYKRFSDSMHVILIWRLLSGVPDYFGRNKISSGGDLSHYSSASLY